MLSFCHYTLSVTWFIPYRIVKELEHLVGVTYKPANQQVTPVSTRNDKVGGQSSPTLSAGSVNGHYSVLIIELFICC